MSISIHVLCYRLSVRRKGKERAIKIKGQKHWKPSNASNVLPGVSQHGVDNNHIIKIIIINSGSAI